MGIRSRNWLQGGWQRPARHLPPAPARAVPHPCCAIPPPVPAVPRGCPTGSVRTAGVVGGRVHVVEVQAAGFGHLQVHHVRGVLQGGHCLLVPHVLQVRVIHLPGAKGAVRWWLSPPAAPSQQGAQEKGPGMGTVALRVPGWHGAYRQQPVPDLQAPVLLGSASLDDLGDVDAVVPWDVLVPDAPCDAEAQSWG